MHHVNNAVIMQTEQLGHIEALEEELRSAKARTEELAGKVKEQDRVIANLMGDNLEHLHVIVMTFGTSCGTNLTFFEPF